MSTTFNITRDQIIAAAMRTLGLLTNPGDTPTVDDITNFAQGLNIMIKAWQRDLHLWKYNWVTVPMLTNVLSYQIGPTATGPGAVVTDRPLKVFDGSFIRNLSPSPPLDTPLVVISKQEYSILGSKQSQGVPNQVYYDPQLNNGVLYVFDMPVVTGQYEIHLLTQMPLADVNISTDNCEFPNEWLQALKWGLADEMSHASRLGMERLQNIQLRAAAHKSQLDDFDEEEASVFFQPRFR